MLPPNGQSFDAEPLRIHRDASTPMHGDRIAHIPVHSVCPISGIVLELSQQENASTLSTHVPRSMSYLQT